MSISVSLQDIVAKMTLHEVERHKHAPPMPIDNQTRSTLVCLPIVPRSLRRLRWIMRIASDEFRVGVQQYIQDMPEIYPTKEQKEELILPRPETSYLPSNFRTDHQIRKFVEFVLNTASTIVGKVDPTKAMHTVDPERDSPLHCGWSNMNWGPAHPYQDHWPSVKLVTVALPMWCFAYKDMADFTTPQEFINPASLGKEQPGQCSSAARLWARLHDFCYLHGAHYFVVSTYDQWAFGAFSAHWTASYVTLPMKFDAADPNVIQSLLFWMHSSVGHPKGYTTAKVRETPSFVEQPLHYCHQAVMQPRAALRLACCS